MALRNRRLSRIIISRPDEINAKSPFRPRNTQATLQNEAPFCLHQRPGFLQDILLSMPLLHSRTYSIASSLLTLSSEGHNKLDLMLKRIPNGRFSSVFLNDHSTNSSLSEPALLQYRIVDSVSGPRLRDLNTQNDKPLVAVATGAGFGPTNCLLQARIAAARRRTESEGPNNQTMSLFFGFHHTDVPLAQPILDEASSLGLIGEMHIIESNSEKKRMQDLLVRKDVAEMLKESFFARGRRLVVCMRASRMRRMLGEHLNKVLGSEVFETFYEERHFEEKF